MNSKSNNFQSRRTEFRAKLSLNKEGCTQAMPPHVHALQLGIAVTDLRSDTTKAGSHKPLITIIIIIIIIMRPLKFAQVFSRSRMWSA
jgi:hypothetical protein